MTLAVLGGSLPKAFAQTLQEHKGKVGQSYDKIIIELGVDKPVAKKAAPAVQETAVEGVIVVQDEVVEDPIDVGSEMDDA
jgi:hypothetical protein